MEAALFGSARDGLAARSFYDGPWAAARPLVSDERLLPSGLTASSAAVCRAAWAAVEETLPLGCAVVVLH